MKNNIFEKLELDNAAKIFPGQNTKRWANVFRLSVQLKQEISPELLRTALDRCLERIPGFRVKIVRGPFWFHFEPNPERCPIRRDVSNFCYRISFSEDNGYLFRVFYDKNTISLDVYHALSDGYGAAVFLCTLTAEYLRLCGYEISTGGMVLDTAALPESEELEDAYRRYAASKIKYNRKDSFMYHTKGTMLPEHRYNYTVITMSLKELLGVSRSQGVTATELLATLLLELQYKKQLAQGKKQKPVSVQVPVNLRKHFPTKSLRNFVLCMRAKIEPQKKQYSFRDLLFEVSSQLRSYNTPEWLDSLMSQNLRAELNPVTKHLPLALKNIGVGIGFAITAEQTTSTLISNLGAVELPEGMGEHIERFFFYTGPGKLNGARCGVISHGDKLVLTFSSIYKENDIENGLLRRLSELGIEAQQEKACEGARVFVPTK